MVTIARTIGKFFDKYGLVVAFAMIVGIIALIFYQDSRDRTRDRRHQDEQAIADEIAAEKARCEFALTIYDGQINYTIYLAERLEATEEQTQEALDVLRATIGERPSC